MQSGRELNICRSCDSRTNLTYTETVVANALRTKRKRCIDISSIICFTRISGVKISCEATCYKDIGWHRSTQRYAGSVMGEFDRLAARYSLNWVLRLSASRG